MSNLVSDWGIYYDPQPDQTIIKDDEELIEIYREAGDIKAADQEDDHRKVSKWLLRFRMNSDPTTSVFDDEYFVFSRDVVERIN